MKIGILVLFCFSMCKIFSQNGYIKKSELLQNVRIYDLKRNLNFLASKEMEGRATGYIGNTRAADYIASYFRQNEIKGFSKSYKQSFPVFMADSIESALIVNGKSLKCDIDYQPSPYFSVELPFQSVLQFSEFIDCRFGIIDSLRNDYAGKDVTGKMVLIRQGSDETKGDHWDISNPQSNYFKILMAIKKGASVVLLVSPGNLSKSNCGNNQGYRLKSAYQTQIFPPVFTITQKTAGLLLNSNNKLDTVGYQVTKQSKERNVIIRFSKRLNNRGSANVVGYIEGYGELKNEWVIVSAHFDHKGKVSKGIMQGADDNASGTTALMSIAKAISIAKTEGNGPKRSVLFVAFSGEEIGLWGSKYYCDNPAVPLERTSALINLDMVGRIDENYIGKGDSANYVYVIGEGRTSSEITEIVEGANCDVNLRLDRKHNASNDGSFFSSDQYWFAKKGVPVIYFFSGFHPDYHETTDTPDKINYLALQRRTKLVLLTVMEIANRNNLLKRDLVSGL